MAKKKRNGDKLLNLKRRLTKTITSDVLSNDQNETRGSPGKEKKEVKKYAFFQGRSQIRKRTAGGVTISSSGSSRKSLGNKGRKIIRS